MTEHSQGNKEIAYEVEVDIALNVFMDSASEFVHEFKQSRRLRKVAQRIRDTLLHGISLPYDNPNHPFIAYGALDSEKSNIARLAKSVMAFTMEPELRNSVISFFHSGGVYRPALEELMKEFWVYTDTCLDITDEEDEDDEDDEEDEEDEDDEEDDDNDNDNYNDVNNPIQIL